MFIFNTMYVEKPLSISFMLPQASFGVKQIPPRVSTQRHMFAVMCTVVQQATVHSQKPFLLERFDLQMLPALRSGTGTNVQRRRLTQSLI
jgi:hypothetical protein